MNFALMEESKKVCQSCRSDLSLPSAKLIFRCMDTHLITFLTNSTCDVEHERNRVARMDDRRHNEPRMSAEEHDLHIKKGDKIQMRGRNSRRNRAEEHETKQESGRARDQARAGETKRETARTKRESEKEQALRSYERTVRWTERRSV